MNVYFDNAASTMVRDEAIEAMTDLMRNEFGNPSSEHYMGRSARDRLEAARKSIADALGAREGEVYFTSGGTESDNWAVLGAAEAGKRRGRHIITSAIEHDAVIKPMEKLSRDGFEITYLEPDSNGAVPLGAFASALREDTILASVMLVNNETGALNPVAEYAREIKRRALNTILHTDAVQGFCKLPFTVKTLGVDLLTISAHKIHGPKGTGALFIRDGSIKIPAMILGGGHEREKRSGTEALPAICGFGVAARLGHIERDRTAAAVGELREYAIEQLRRCIPETVIIGGGSPFLLSISLPGHKSETLMNYLEGQGICVSKSSACKKGARSRVLEAMRLKNDVIDGALRVSFSRYSTRDQCDYFVEKLKTASQTILRAL